MESDRVWIFIKYLAYSIIAILGIVLLVQYINLAQLTHTNSSLIQQANSLQQEYNQKSDLESDLEENYNQYIEDEAKENQNMKNENEEVIVGK